MGIIVLPSEGKFLLLISPKEQGTQSLVGTWKELEIMVRHPEGELGMIRNDVLVSIFVAFETVLQAHYEIQKLRCLFASGKKETDIPHTHFCLKLQ